MVLHQEPNVTAPRQQRGAQAAVRQQFLAGMFGQDADGLMGPDQRSDDADIIRDTARALLQSPRLQELGFRRNVEVIRIAADCRLEIGRGGRLEKVQPDFRKLRDREITLVRLAQANGEIGAPSGKISRSRWR